jgi:hypothetical protein
MAAVAAADTYFGKSNTISTFFGGKFSTFVFRTSARETFLSRNGAKRLSQAVLGLLVEVLAELPASLVVPAISVALRSSAPSRSAVAYGSVLDVASTVAESSDATVPKLSSSGGGQRGSGWTGWHRLGVTARRTKKASRPGSIGSRGLQRTS